MAKLSGPLGSKLRGKVGEVVAAKTVTGETAIRSYQPVVKNPRTARQIECRDRMAMASALGAALAPVIGIGYAKAASAARRYPRNLFVKRTADHDTTPITFMGGEAEIDYSAVKVSQQAGVVGLPSFGTAASASGKINVPLSAFPAATDPDAYNMGVVVCAYNTDEKVCLVGQGLAPDVKANGLELTVPTNLVGLDFEVYGFCKEILNAHTDIQTETQPWKYPSNTSGSIYIGKVTTA